MVHGRTRIKLVNPITRRIVKDYVDENTFQGSVISEGLRNLGYAKASLYNTPDTSNPPFSEIIGGILLLDSQIPENSQFVPLGVSMTGNGAYGITNSSDPAELGSYNDISSEILISQKKIKMVYDYSRLQANGTIASVCLTSRTGGYIGIGNKNNKRTSTVWSLSKNAGLANICPQITSSLGPNNVVCNGALYNFSLDNDVLTIKKRRVPLKNASLLDCIEETKTLSVSSLHYSGMGTSFNVSASNGKIYMSQTGFVTVGTAFVWCYDLANNTISELSFTDTRNYRAYNGPFICHDQAYIFNNDSGAFEVYQLNGTHIHTITAAVGSGGHSDNLAGTLGNHVLFQWRNEDYTRRCYLYDSELNTALEINASDLLSNIQNQGLSTDETSQALCFVTSSGVNPTFQGAYAFNNPFYLATINNLQTAVIKDITYEMIVEYTLTET